MMNERRISIAVLLVFLIISPGCTVKEDRELCPCWLLEDLSECYGSDSPLYISAWKNGRLFLEAINVRYFPAGFETTVARNVVEVSAYQGLKEMFQDGHRLLIPSGNEADSIYAHCSTVNATGESAYDLISLHKQFATVTVVISDCPDYVSHELVLKGNVCGMDILDFSPIEGSFHCRAREMGKGVWSFRLPRQKDASLTLELIENGEFLKEYRVGEAILSGGYSWNKEDLDDIHLELEYNKSSVSVTVKDWEAEKDRQYNY